METAVFTLKDFMELEQFPRQVLLTPELDPRHIVLQHVSVIEAPIEQFVRRGELVITTVLGCRDDPDAFLGFIRSICECAAAAIAVSFPEDRIDLVPQEILDCARSYGVAMVYLPWEYRFAEITETVVSRLRGLEKRESATWEKFQKQMLSAYLQHQNIQQAAALIARELGADMLIVDMGGRPIADTRQQRLPEDRPLPEGVMAAYHLLVHINAQGQDLGCLYVDAARATPALLGRVLPFSTYLLTPLLLWFDREDISQANRLRALDDMVRGLASGALRAGEETLFRARTLGLRLTRPHFCLAANVRILPPREGVRAWLDDHERELLRLLLEKSLLPMVTIYQEHIVLYAERETEPEALIERLRRALRPTFPELHCVWGVSSEEGASEFDRLYREARLAADLCRRENAKSGVYHQRDIRLYRLVSACLADADSRRLRRELIGPLLAYDQETGSRLEEVLTAYLRCQGNACKAAEQLHFHRQSLRYRLRKIEELLGFPLSDHDRLLEVEVSLRLHRYETPSGGEPERAASKEAAPAGIAGRGGREGDGADPSADAQALSF